MENADTPGSLTGPETTVSEVGAVRVVRHVLEPVGIYYEIIINVGPDGGPRFAAELASHDAARLALQICVDVQAQAPTAFQMAESRIVIEAIQGLRDAKGDHDDG